MKLNNRSALGFTLIELMIVVAVVGILSMIGFPSYRNYIMKANRSSAQQLMLNIQNREEQYILDARAYSNVLGPDGLNIRQEGWDCGTAASTTCSSSFYNVTVAVTAGTPPTYIVTAAPITGSYQVADGSLTLSSGGAKARTAGDLKW